MSNNKFKLNGRATAIGSMPHTNPEAACSLILDKLRDIPVWPQLPERSFLENMYAQYSEGFPGIVLEDERIWVDRSRDLSQPLEKLYTDYLESNIDQAAVSYEYAEGLHVFLEQAKQTGVKAVKGQVTGPISFGLTVTDQDRRPLLYDEVLADALAKHLRMKAMWQEKVLSAISPNTIISIDEPYLSSMGSSFISFPAEQVVHLLEEVLSGISGYKAIHCCGNTDWSILLKTSIDILSLDAYSYGETLSLYIPELNDFLERGGIIAWGIIPNDEKLLAGEDINTIVNRLDDTIDIISSKGIDISVLRSQCLITPACSLASLSIDSSKRALEITASVSEVFRERHNIQ